MPTTNIDLLHEINSISKIHSLQRSDIDTMMKEFAERITATLHIEKLSVWIINEDRNAIVSMGEYDLPSKHFEKDNILWEDDSPNYFGAISENEILVVPNVYESEKTKQLVSSYFKPNNIISLMDIPLRIEGQLVGIMCFEKTGAVPKIFSDKDQLFALSVGMVFASNLEARQRRAIQHALDKELKEKDVLIHEINHRVKNNIAVIASLLNLQATKAKDSFHRSLLQECKNKIDAISSIHNITYKTDSYAEINIRDFVQHLIDELLIFYKSDNQNIKVTCAIDSVIIKVDKAISLALIINEVITNCYKHAFQNRAEGNITIHLHVVDNVNKLTIQDDGDGIDLSTIENESLGIEIIKGLAEQLDGKMKFENKSGTLFTLTF